VQSRLTRGTPFAEKRPAMRALRSKVIAVWSLLIAATALWFASSSARASHAPSKSRDSAISVPRTASRAPAARRATAPAIPDDADEMAPAPTEPAPQRAREHRPDDLTLQEQLERAQERETLWGRWTRQKDREPPNPAAKDEAERRLKEALLGEEADPDSVLTLDCRRSICRMELATVGIGVPALKEVKELIHAVRQLKDTWVQATEVEPGSWRVEAYAATEGYALTGDRAE
jgi:hypothetical protein